MTLEELNSRNCSRKDYIKEYHHLGSKMFSTCLIPTVSTFAEAFKNNNAEAMKHITTITDFTGNFSKIETSMKRTMPDYEDKDSKEFMDSVIAANVTDITQSGHFYKKLVSSMDDMAIEIDDCGSEGYEFTLPLAEDEEEAIKVFEYKIRNRWVMELNKYVEDFEDLPKSGTIHVRTFLTCNHGKRKFCKKCAGLFRRSYDTEFTPKNIGIYATLMITEHATQASLDSMNKGTSEKINAILEKKFGTEKIKKSSDGTTTVDIKPYKDFDKYLTSIYKTIDSLQGSGVESRFYELALLSRWRNGEVAQLQSSMTKQEDLFGAFIYSTASFTSFINSKPFELTSIKSHIALEKYD